MVYNAFMATLEQLKRIIPKEPRLRRQVLIDEMSTLEANGYHCFQCTGICCTFVANSMMTTPLETAELLLFLVQEERWNANTMERLRETVRHYRLDREPPGDGRRSFSRRTYTCPFFNEQQLGCSISRSAKPYGCLGFNARSKGVTEGGDCASNTQLLAQRDDIFGALERELNQRIQQALGLTWEKLPMPQALLVLSEALN